MKKSILITLICVLALTTVFVVLHYNRPNAGGQQTQPQQEEQVAAEVEEQPQTEPEQAVEPVAQEDAAQPVVSDQPAQPAAVQQQQQQPAAKSILTDAYIDLGLPSGTRWRGVNEDCGLLTYDDAVAVYKNKLPSKAQIIELKEKCEWKKVDEGYLVTGPNGNSILLTVDGYRNCSGQMSGVGTVGSYWSSTAEDRESAWRIGFEPDRIPHVTKISVTNHLRCYARSVRLVK